MQVAQGRARATGITSAGFNQDQTCLCVGTVNGSVIYNVGSTLSQCTRINDVAGGYRVVKMLFSTSLLAAVPGNKPRQVHLLNTQQSAAKPIVMLTYLTPVLDIHLNMSKLVVVLETKIHLYDLKKMEEDFCIDTAPNPEGICALSDTSDCLIAYPQSMEDGSVILFDGMLHEIVNIVPAHASRLKCLMFNPDGDLLASASEKGTVIYVHEVGPGSKIRRRVGYRTGSPSAPSSAEETLSEKDCYAFRRGSFSAEVTRVAFSRDSSLLLCASLTGTVHAFKINRVSSSQPSFVASYLPQMIAGMWEPQRSFASIKLPPAVRVVLSTSESNREIRVFAEDGMYRSFSIDLHEGGEGTAVQEVGLSLPSEELENSVRADFL